jgi:hypothetical protein
MLSQRPGQSGCITCLAPSTPILRDSDGACVNCAYLLQCEAECEETLCHLAPQAAHRTLLADCPDCRRIGAECRVHSVKAGRHLTSAQCSPAGAKKIADRRCKIGERLDLQGLRERFPCNCSHSKASDLHVRLLDGGVVRQVPVGRKFGVIRRREELMLHEIHPEQG